METITTKPNPDQARWGGSILTVGELRRLCDTEHPQPTTVA